MNYLEVLLLVARPSLLKKEKYLSSDKNEINYCAIPFTNKKVNINFGSGIQ